MSNNREIRCSAGCAKKLISLLYFLTLSAMAYLILAPGPPQLIDHPSIPLSRPNPSYSTILTYIGRWDICNRAAYSTLRSTCQLNPTQSTPHPQPAQRIRFLSFIHPQTFCSQSTSHYIYLIYPIHSILLINVNLHKCFRHMYVNAWVIKGKVR